jgi:hypothetical protein
MPSWLIVTVMFAVGAVAFIPMLMFMRKEWREQNRLIEVEARRESELDKKIDAVLEDRDPIPVFEPEAPDEMVN